MDIDALLKTVMLSEDMTRATDLTPADVAELLDRKLLLDEISPGEFREALSEIQTELEREVNALLFSQGLGAKELDKLGAQLQHDKVQWLHLKNLMAAAKLLRRLRDEHVVDGDDDEAIVDACNLILYMTRIRIQRDAVPLITRGLYASQVIEAIGFWKEHRAAESGRKGCGKRS